MHQYITVTFIFFCLVVNIHGYQFYQKLIPNGEAIRNPRNKDEYWPGVGHNSQYGKGPRNNFGIDFKNAGHTWTKELCLKDSDGDGMSNGAELGDPDCQWKRGETPAITDEKHLSHPGICESIDSDSKDLVLTCSASLPRALSELIFILASIIWALLMN